MGVKKFEIVLDSPVCYSGQQITGKLLVDIEDPVKIRGIRLNYSGKATVRWTEGSGKNKRTYTNKETYLDLQQLVHGSYEKETEIAVGQYVFIFNCQLPKDSPCSYEGAWGRIKYSVKATMDIPWARDPVSKHPLTVVSVFDLNKLPFAAAPVSEYGSKTFWGQSNAVSLSFELPIRGYVPGQMISATVQLKNDSEVEVKRIAAELHQNVMFHATTKSRPWKELVSRVEYPIDSMQGLKQCALRFKVPVVPSSYLEFCSIIDLRYHLTISAEVGVLHRDLEVPTEVLIGNIPLMSYQQPIAVQQPPPMPIDPENPSHSQAANYRPPPYNVVSSASSMYENLSPPSYEQCMGYTKSDQNKSSDDSDSDTEVRKFSSLYPVYQFDNPKE